MVNRDLSSGAHMVLPQERHETIRKILSLSTTGLDSAKDQLLKRVVQNTDSEESLQKHLKSEDAGVVAEVLVQCAAATHSLDMVVCLLELMVLVFRTDATVLQAFAALAASLPEGRDPAIHLDKWANDETCKVTTHALEAFSMVLVHADEAYLDRWLKTLLRTVQVRLKDAKQAQEPVPHNVVIGAEGAVKALSILAGPVHLRGRVVAQSVPGDLSPPALLPTLLFPGETAFATACAENHQFIYDAAKAVWLLTFSGEVLDDLDAQCRPGYDVAGHSNIAVINNLLRKQKKEKIIRMSLQVLANYVKHHESNRPSVATGFAETTNYLKDMIGVGMVHNLEMLQKRTFGDEDIPLAIQELIEVLEVNVDDLSSYAVYRQEVLSGMLEWSPPHTSEKFWKENIKSLENDNYAPIRELAKIILTNQEPRNVQIACHDMGEFVRHHPQGKRQWEKLRIKERVYELIEHGLGQGSSASAQQERDAVKRHALLAMQKIMVKRWDLL
eukprot:TRINITY_DN22280_c0_g1_i1.p1 TRINITY_DN22280_c0_g1~~TRINITY_DN22280_c0_g1_i1.p1  ORF type:complete len:500 (+),score=230.44 TRINITY_DN22280_c0_g1_i1:66-1565(+)